MNSGTESRTENIGHLILTLQFEREGKNWVGTCVELGTSTFACNTGRAQQKLRESIVSHLDALEEEGERERFFEEYGIEVQRERDQDRELVVRMPLNRMNETGLFYQPDVFPFPEPAEQLAIAGS